MRNRMLQVQFIMYKMLEGCRLETEISHVQHQVVKIRDREGASKVLKILTFPIQKECLLMRTKLQIQKRKEYLRRRYQKSQIQVDRMMMLEEIQVKKNNEVKILKILAPYVQHSNLSLYYIKASTNRAKHIPHNLQNVIYMFEEFFQVIWRGGGMQNFFYTPQNLFIVHPERDFKAGWPTLQVNYGSFVGLRLLNDENNLNRDEFLQIYPLLSPQLFKLLKNPDRKQIERKTKMRALGWLIFTFIIRKVQDMLFDKKLNVLVSRKEMEQLLQLSNQRFKQALKTFKSRIDQIGKKTSIKLYDLLLKIFIEDCANLTWGDIQYTLFASNIYSKNLRVQEIRLLEQELTQKQNRNQVQIKRKKQQAVNCALIKLFWLCQRQKEFYSSRGIEDHSYLFMLVKLNLDFHYLLKKYNLAQILQRSQFSEISEKLFGSMMEIPGEMKKLLEEQQNKELQMKVQTVYQQLQNALHSKNPQKRQIQKNKSNQQNFQPQTSLLGDYFKMMIEQQLWGQSMMKTTKSKEAEKITSIHKNYQALKTFENSLWLQ